MLNPEKSRIFYKVQNSEEVMKILSLHCDFISFHALKKALKSVEPLSEREKTEQTVKDCLVIMTAVERGDNGEVFKDYIKNVEDIAGQVKTKNLVLYPYAHLSSSLSDPETAIKMLKDAEQELGKKGYKVTRAPFGYYKEFNLKVKGHPLSELSREFHPKGFAKPAASEKNAEPEEEINREELLRKMSKIKMSTQKTKSGLKSNIELGRDMDLYIISEIVGGGLPLFTPLGTTIIRGLKRFIEDEELKRGYEYTLTPVMAKSDLYKISGHWQHYKDGMFVMKVRGQDFALRPMTCPFQFVLYKRKPRSYRELPKRYAEIADLFRNEQSGE